MFFQLLFIHLYRPFLKYNRTTSPLPQHVSPRKFCTQAAAAISKLLRLYKRTHGLRQICNIAVYIAHSACTIHLLNLPDKNARRDIIHGVKHLEEIGEGWTCARRTLHILRLSAEKWKIDIPDEAATVFMRATNKWGESEQVPSPSSDMAVAQISQPVYQQSSPQNNPSPRTTTQSQSMPSVPTSLVPTHDSERQANAARAASFNPQLQHFQNGLYSGIAPSPASSAVSDRRSSGGMSLPPQNADVLKQARARQKSSNYLTQAQQDTWNAHHARLGANNGGKSGNQDTSAASLFGGVDSLVEESQDWWLKDQSQLALGFDNWGGDSMNDWSNLYAGNGLSGIANDVGSSNNINGGNNSLFYNNNFQNDGGYTTYGIPQMSNGKLTNSMRGRPGGSLPTRDKFFEEEAYY